MLLVVCIAFVLQSAPVFAVANHPIHWGFQRAKNETPPQAGAVLDRMLEKYDAFYLGDTKKKMIYLTFDNGYENGYTAKILDVLREKKVPAAFFVTGAYLRTAPNLVQRMVNEGHVVGNHSYHHPDMTTISDEEIREELQQVVADYTKVTGKTEMHYLRPPRGVFSERVLKVARDEGYVSVFWSLAFVDWRVDAQRGEEYSYQNVMKQIHPGSVLLLHAVSSDNAAALGRIIDDLHKRGYTFETLDSLMFTRHVPLSSSISH
ncbi:MAG: delta-lactam-biosynthetic de-N-acetylase [Bacilli bacterium]